eukprot:CAMPEP_0201482012 /NCGR_PEP_ID=MMETSP0151_2-20130828/6264_1 /ASSEMBLY_ACC=CAM_ASM_000257 /TAXON_ID=200890 /ORGANISM="Paramoeba atlantica, Strain 621/1 / CCAP 1560/9" /LENGTH=593 /DNA_ID=CAMNT_0047864467 /DNA_START=340 /DNA_END=2118 /DNA_ORIENTATION=-
MASLLQYENEEREKGRDGDLIQVAMRWEEAANWFKTYQGEDLRSLSLQLLSRASKIMEGNYSQRGRIERGRILVEAYDECMEVRACHAGSEFGNTAYYFIAGFCPVLVDPPLRCPAAVWDERGRSIDFCERLERSRHWRTKEIWWEEEGRREVATGQANKAINISLMDEDLFYQLQFSKEQLAKLKYNILKLGVRGCRDTRLIAKSMIMAYDIVIRMRSVLNQGLSRVFRKQYGIPHGLPIVHVPLFIGADSSVEFRRNFLDSVSLRLTDYGYWKIEMQKLWQEQEEQHQQQEGEEGEGEKDEDEEDEEEGEDEDEEEEEEERQQKKEKERICGIDEEKTEKEEEGRVDEEEEEEGEDDEEDEDEEAIQQEPEKETKRKKREREARERDEQYRKEREEYEKQKEEEEKQREEESNSLWRKLNKKWLTEFTSQEPFSIIRDCLESFQSFQHGHFSPLRAFDRTWLDWMFQLSDEAKYFKMYIPTVKELRERWESLERKMREREGEDGLDWMWWLELLYFRVGDWFFFPLGFVDQVKWFRGSRAEVVLRLKDSAIISKHIYQILIEAGYLVEGWGGAGWGGGEEREEEEEEEEEE